MATGLFDNEAGIAGTVLLVDVEGLIRPRIVAVPNAASSVGKGLFHDHGIALVDGDEELVDEGIGKWGSWGVIGAAMIVENLFAETLDEFDALIAKTTKGAEDEGEEWGVWDERAVFGPFGVLTVHQDTIRGSVDVRVVEGMDKGNIARKLSEGNWEKQRGNVRTETCGVGDAFFRHYMNTMAVAERRETLIRKGEFCVFIAIFQYFLLQAQIA